jgi:hypothetical protein
MLAKYGVFCTRSLAHGEALPEFPYFAAALIQAQWRGRMAKKTYQEYLYVYFFLIIVIND